MAFFVAETGTDAPSVEDLPANLLSEEKCAEGGGAIRKQGISADQGMTGLSAFGLDPIFTSPAGIRAEKAFTHDAFQLHLAGGIFNRFGRAGNMGGDHEGGAGVFQEAFEFVSSFLKGRLAEVMTVQGQ